MKYFNVLILAFLIACGGNYREGDVHNNEREDGLISEIRQEERLVPIEGAIGVIVAGDDYQFGDTVDIFDADKRPIREITITEESQELVLKCVAKNSSFYEVRLEDGRLGFIARNESGVKFQTWDEHVLSVFAVGFNENLNPLKERPSEMSSTVMYVRDAFYHPSKIDGEWLEVKWGSERNWQYAWIRWRENEKLLIELFYFA